MDSIRAAWTGQWIWGARTALGGPTESQPYGSHDRSRFDTRVLFRREFEVDEPPASAWLRITADSRYTAYVNGVELGTGPIRHGTRHLDFDRYDVHDLLREGSNVIAVLARFYGHAVPWWQPSPPSFGLGGGAIAAELSLDDVVLGTDERWRQRAGDAWQANEPAGMLLSQLAETLDARLLDPDWNAVGYDDSDWSPARIISERSVIGPVGATRPGTEPWGGVAARPIPLLVGETRFAAPDRQCRIAAVDTDDPAGVRHTLRLALHAAKDVEQEPPRTPIEPGGATIVVLADFGCLVSGLLDIEITADRGMTVLGALVELPTAAALASSSAFHYTARGERDRIAPTDQVGGRYLVLCMTGTGTVELGTVRLHERHRPRVPVTPFSSSDPSLDEIYRVGVRTVDLTAHDAYVDCPTREQRAWTGDAVVHQSVDLVVNQDWSLARWNPELLAEPRADGLLPMVVAGDFANTDVPTIPDWSLHWIRSLHNLYRYTGDHALVGRLLPAAERVLRWFEPYQDESGLIGAVPGWVLIDWSPVQVAGTSAALNGLWARGLRDFAEIAAWLGDAGRAAWAKARHAEVRAGFELFWDDRRGAYRDTLVDGVRGTSVSEHTAAAAVCGDLVPPEHSDAVLRLLLDRDAMFTDSPLADHGSDAAGPANGRPVSIRPAPDWDTERLVVGAQPFFRYVVHDALALLGAADRIAALCRDWQALLKDGPTAFRECWEGGSYCHGWSSTPTRDLVVYTIGITPARPGYDVVRIEPRLGYLAHAAGEVPTPHGVVAVAVHGDLVTFDSPVPVEIVNRAGEASGYPAGTGQVDISR